MKGFGGLGGWRTSGDHQNYSIIENGQNTKKNLRDLRRLAVIQAPVKDHQLKLMWKTQWVNNNNDNKITLTAQISLTLSLSVFIIHYSGQDLQTTSIVHTKLIQVSFCWSTTPMRLCVGVQRRTPLMHSFLLLQQCPECLACLTWITFEIGSMWAYSCFFASMIWLKDHRAFSCNSHLAFSPRVFLTSI